LNSTVKVKSKRISTAQKTPERNAKHKILKQSKPSESHIVNKMHQVDLDEIGMIEHLESPEQALTSSDGTSSTEKINKRIEKKHLYKPYKTSAIIPETEEYLETPTKTMVAKIDLSDEKLTPSQQILKNEEEAYGNFNKTQKLTSDVLRTANLGSKRSGLGNSLINFAMQGMTLLIGFI